MRTNTFRSPHSSRPLQWPDAKCMGAEASNCDGEKNLISDLPGADYSVMCDVSDDQISACCL